MEVRVEQVLGRRVHGPDGRAVGRLEEIRVEADGPEHRVAEYLVGTAALVQRLSANLFPFLGFGIRGYAVRWDQMDLSDPERPRITCDVSELRRFDTGGKDQVR